LVRQEHRAEEPVFSPHIFRDKVFVIASCVIGLTFMALMGTVVFLPLFFQLVLGFTPSRAGLMMAPIPVGVIASSFLGGRLVSKTGRYKIFPIIGLICATSALLCVMWASAVGARLLVIENALLLVGFGFGFVMPNLTIAIQNAVNPSELGMATATAGFFRSLGGAFGVAMSGAIVTTHLHHIYLGFGYQTHSLVNQGIQQIAQLPIVQREIVLTAYRKAISSTFLAGAAIAAAALAITIFLPEKTLKTVLPTGAGESESLSAPEMLSASALENTG
jgi:MFS family permease